MNNKKKFLNLVMLSTLLLAFLAACGQKKIFYAPEIEPPADLIPGYVPEGFKLMGGFQLEMGEIATRIEVGKGEHRVTWIKELDMPFFDLKTPARNDLLGLYYQKGDRLLLITKSYFPGGTLEAWREQYEASLHGKLSCNCDRDCDCDSGCDCDCDCGCGCDCCYCLRGGMQFMLDFPLALRLAQLQEVRTIGDREVAILLNSRSGYISVFVLDDYLVAVEGGFPLEENLKILESLPGW